MSQTPRRRRNVAKMLARLNPKSMPLEPGAPGGIPIETALDIAGALGAAGFDRNTGGGSAAQRLAVLALCLRWWPGVFEGPMQVVGHRDTTRTVTITRIAGLRLPVEIDHCPKPALRTRGGRLLTKAERADAPLLPPRKAERLCRQVGPKRHAERETVKQTFIERVPIEVPSETPAFEAIASLIATKLRHRLERDRAIAAETIGMRVWAELRRERWQHLRHGQAHSAPLDDALAARVLTDRFLAGWARVVIHEYRHPNHCQTCQPWGKVGEVPKPIMEAGKIVRVEWQPCENCTGQGVLAWSSKRRAKALSIGEHPFRNWLAPHHNGALSLLRELEYRGAILLVHRLGHSDER